MSSEGLPLLASVSGLAAESLGAVMGEMPFGDIHSFLLLLAVAPGVVMLVSLGIGWLRGPQIDDEPDAPLAGAAVDELTQLARDTIDQLNGSTVALRDSLPEAGQALSREPPATTGLPCPNGRNAAGHSDTAATEEANAERVATGDEPASPCNLQLLGSAFDAVHRVTHDEALAQLAAKMHKLTELTGRMRDERQALERHAGDSPPAAGTSTPNRHYLSFTLGDEQFAVSTRRILVVVEAIRLIAEPIIPPKIRKAIRLSSALVPVIDLNARFGGQSIEIDRNSRIVVLELTGGDRSQLIGLLVDTVGKVLEITRTGIEPPTASGSRIRDDFTLGTTSIDNHLVTLLDLDRGFSANDLMVLLSADQVPAQENSPA